MRYLVHWHNQGILDVNSLVWAPKLSTQIKEKVMQEKVLEMLIHLFLKQISVMWRRPSNSQCFL